MKIDSKTGVMEFTSELVLQPGMTRSQILSLNVEWEEWTIIDNIPRSFRTIFQLTNKGANSKNILVVYVGTENRPISFWDLGPWNGADGEQNRPEGKYTKKMRIWFKSISGVDIPLKREWGHIDASFDPWNQSAGVICNYRERFESDEEWSRYKKNNKF